MNVKVGCAYPLNALYENVKANSLACKSWTAQLPAHEGHAVIIGGGPSLPDFLPSIKWRHSLGQTIFALNGACRFLNDNGIIPDYQVFLDANKEMGDRIGNAREYLVASQCDPILLAALPANRITLWHFGLPDLEKHVPEHNAEWNIIGGGLTIGLTSMCLAYAMGYRVLHLYGYDSSNKAGKDHGYAVPITEERLGDQILNSVSVEYGGRTFQSTLAMTAQAELFPKVCNNLIDAGTTITVDVDPESLLAAVMAEVRASIAAAAAN